MNSNLIRYVLIVMAIAGLSWLSAAQAEEPADSIRLTVTAISPEISKSEPVTVELLFESGNETIRLYKHPVFGMAAAARGLDGWLSFVITTPSGGHIKDFGTHLPGPKRPFKGDSVDVGPDSPYRETIKLYPGSYEKDALWPEPGEYQMQAVYSLQQDKHWEYGHDLWEGEIRSNRITFTVTAQAGKGTAHEENRPDDQ